MFNRQKRSGGKFVNQSKYKFTDLKKTGKGIMLEIIKKHKKVLLTGGVLICALLFSALYTSNGNSKLQSKINSTVVPAKVQKDFTIQPEEAKNSIQHAKSLLTEVTRGQVKALNEQQYNQLSVLFSINRSLPSYSSSEASKRRYFGDFSFKLESAGARKVSDQKIKVLSVLNIEYKGRSTLGKQLVEFIFNKERGLSLEKVNVIDTHIGE